MKAPLHRVFVVFLSAATLLILAGCYSIPQHSAVTAAQARDQQLPDSVGFAPAPPKPNADPTAIVAGFIAAGTGQANDYAVAREFLAPSFASEWRPDEAVLVYDGGARLSVQNDQIRYTIVATAQINNFGIYSTSSAKRQNLDYTVSKIDGEWRITAGPQGIVLGADNFDRLFTPRALYFPSADGRTFIPDLRWFRSTISPASLVRTLAAGASPILQEGVTTNPLTDLRSVVSVGVADGVATVSLAARTNDLTEHAQRVATQVGISLQSIRPVNLIRLFVDGRLATTDSALPSAPYQSGSNIALRGDRVGYLSGSQDTDELPPSKTITSSHPTQLTYLSSSRIAAGTTSRGLVEWTNSTALLLEPGTNFIDPSIDRWGWVWTAAAANPNRPVIALTPKQKRSLNLGLEDATSIQAMEVSPEGYRLLELYTTNQGPKAEIHGIIRDAHGAPTGITTAFVPIAIRAVEGIDATWIDAESVAILSKTSNTNRVTAQQVNGTSTDLGQITGATAISGGQSTLQLAVLLKNGDVATTQSSGVWTTTASNVAVLGSTR